MNFTSLTLKKSSVKTTGVPVKPILWVKITRNLVTLYKISLIILQYCNGSLLPKHNVILQQMT